MRLRLIDKVLERLEKLNSRNRLRTRLRKMQLHPTVIDAFLRAFEPVERRKKPSTFGKTSKGAGSLWSPNAPPAVYVADGYVQTASGIRRAKPKRDKGMSARQCKRLRMAVAREMQCAA
jgi:hypothetical protein